MTTGDWDTGTRVKHREHGFGTVQFCQGLLTIVEFDHAEPQLQRVETAALCPVLGADEVAAREQWDSPLQTICRGLAESIVSVNDAWGVFSPSNIDLLPHQLWVCKKVNERWPTHWMIADDVGLGKTIEAGLILWPLLSRGVVRRVLILTPAALTEQWCNRLYDMFDIRTRVYKGSEDTESSRFWEREDQVVASFHTLRMDRNGRHDRILNADPWDLVMVDEAHHLHCDEATGPTLAYRFVERLTREDKVQSLVFFTGTPHRGKDYGFLSLLALLRADLFSPRKPIGGQLSLLPEVLIRNNKYSVTDLKGTQLFKVPKVRPLNYSYSVAEQNFYDLISSFIERGYAYSSSIVKTQGQSMGNAVALVLIAIQKLAASSVAAVLRALEKRLGRKSRASQEINKLNAAIEALSEQECLESDDRLAELEEELAELSAHLSLMEDEEPHLKALVKAAREVQEETKFELIITLLQKEYPDRQVLFFTEYKATQALLLSRLRQTFGDNSAVFINGEDRVENVQGETGGAETLTMTRRIAAEKFNSGKARFLIATEAGGEGIDLQERCFTLMHVDLPWNPMRMHQRVGRINRYGQTRQVEVILLANRATVEARIYEKLEEKLVQINRAFDEVMDQPEDLFSLVLGMTPNRLFTDLFAEGRRRFQGDQQKGFEQWFDSKTATIGGEDVVDSVRNLIGNCAKFNFQDVSQKIPKVDVAHLKPFFQGMLHLYHRRLQEDEGGYYFLTPDDWKKESRLRPRYKGLRFERKPKSSKDRQNLLGVGDQLMSMALLKARNSEATVTTLPSSLLVHSLHVFRLTDQLTVSDQSVRSQTAGVSLNGQTPRLLRDWELVLELNRLVERSLNRLEAVERGNPEKARAEQQHASDYLKTQLGQLDLPFKFPSIHLLISLIPV